MKTKMAYLSALALIVMTLAGPAGAADIPNSPFTIDPPARWEVINNPPMGMLILFKDAPRGDFASNINVIVQEIGNMGLDEYTRISEESGSKIISNFTLVHKDKITIGGAPFGEIEYTGTMGKYNLHWVAVYTILNGKAFVFTGTTVESYSNEYMPIFRKCFKTIRRAGGSGGQDSQPPSIQSPPHSEGKSK